MRIGRGDACDEDVEAACVAVGLGPLLASLPQGIHTRLGARGSGISAGERQRVGLARAWVRDAKLLLLDEPTANLDGETEREVLEATRRLAEGRTAIVVAHRPALLALADRVVDLGRALGGAGMSLAGCRAGAARRRGGARECLDAGWARNRRSLAPDVRLRRPAAGRLALATLLGAGSVAAAIGLIATSAWLISRSSQRPQESAVAVAIVGVQFFALARGLCRYGERLVGHDAAFRALADLRVRMYERLERLAPLGLPAFADGQLLARLVHDIDSLQDLLLRVVPPFAIASFVGAATVALVWWMLPAAGAILLAGLLIAGVFVPWLTGRLAARGEARQAEARGRLTVSVLDLIEGAPELVANGAAPAQLERAKAADAQLTEIAARVARARPGSARA